MRIEDGLPRIFITAKKCLHSLRAAWALSVRSKKRTLAAHPRRSGFTPTLLTHLTRIPPPTPADPVARARNGSAEPSIQALPRRPAPQPLCIPVCMRCASDVHAQVPPSRKNRQTPSPTLGVPLSLRMRYTPHYGCTTRKYLPESAKLTAH
jgi:hypothetical protein